MQVLDLRILCGALLREGFAYGLHFQPGSAQLILVLLLANLEQRPLFPRFGELGPHELEFLLHLIPLPLRVLELRLLNRQTSLGILEVALQPLKQSLERCIDRFQRRPMLSILALG